MSEKNNPAVTQLLNANVNTLCNNFEKWKNGEFSHLYFYNIQYLFTRLFINSFKYN